MGVSKEKSGPSAFHFTLHLLVLQGLPYLPDPGRGPLRVQDGLLQPVRLRVPRLDDELLGLQQLDLRIGLRGKVQKCTEFCV